jgi:predicted NBD/HSP70 family sugar kinase
MPRVTFTTTGALSKSDLRQGNERLVLDAIRENPTLSRADISRITALSPSTVTFIVERLLKQKLLREEQVENHAQVGRRPTALRLAPRAKVAVGIELTLTEARLVLSDWTGESLKERVIPRPGSHEVFFDKIYDSLRTILGGRSDSQILGVGVGLPGFADRVTGRVIAAENFNWAGVEAGRLLQRDLPFPFFFENSAKLAALAETWFMKREGRPLRDFVFVTMRGGLGTGVMVNGQLLQGASSAAAEFGHTILFPDGRRCACGNIGCWEQYASDLALCRNYLERRPKTRAADAPCAEIIVQRAREGDTVALAVLQETAELFGLGLVNVIMVLNPQAIVVGDFLASGWDLIEEKIWAVLRSRVPSYYLAGVRIYPSEHAANSSLPGCVALVLSNYFKTFGSDSVVNGAPVVIH